MFLDAFMLVLKVTLTFLTIDSSTMSFLRVRYFNGYMQYQNLCVLMPAFIFK